MVKKMAGRTYLEVIFFDGIYEITRRCFPIPGTPLFRITDTQDGEEWTVSKGYKDHVSYCFDVQTTIDIMAETGELEEFDRLWIVNHGDVDKTAKVALSSVYGKCARGE